MTWQLASMACVLLALLAGFAWYERGRPSSKLVALVAALAAVAVAGRVVFAPIPNVQATTDIVLLAGYALGAGPGFVVGAVAALASNFFLGQGPWTPWQMLGWGAVGIAGASVARIRLARSNRTGDPGRWSLAVVCALAGLAFGAWMDLFVLLNFAAERTLDSYLALSAAGLPFNVAHAVGNGVLCLVLGPAFVRLLVRFRRRFEIDWGPAAARPGAVAGGATAASALVLGAGLALAVPPPKAEAAAGVRAAVRYIERAQNSDGGFGAAPGQRSTQLITGWAVLGLEAGGRHPSTVRRGGRTPFDYMRAGSRRLEDIGEVERTILALHGAGRSVHRFAGHHLVRRLLAARRRNGSFAGRVNTTAFGILALRAAGRAPRSRAIRSASRWLLRQRNRDGGYSFSRRGGTSDADDTGAVLQALAAAGRRKARGVRRALSYLRAARNADGGFGQFAHSRSNAQSTAWAAQGLVAAGRDPSHFRHGATRSPLAYLRSLQQRDGSFRYSRERQQTPVWVTAQVIAALRKKTFPIRPPHR